MIDDGFLLDMRVTIYQVDSNGGRRYGGLEVAERAELTAQSFLEVAKVLGEFHDLVEAIRRAEAHAR